MVIVMVAAHFVVKKGTRTSCAGPRGWPGCWWSCCASTSDLLRPLYATVSGVLNASKAEISDDVVGNSLAVMRRPADEGMVLVRTNGLLPLDSGTKNLTWFGWASTNPVYSGKRSANSGDGSAPAFSILQSLANAGYSMNDELVKMYTAIAAARRHHHADPGLDPA